ncbi:hypothetical protein GF362_02405 [Candidatus Dojkabacteria bacterium]|nr:hypothetical protein [Candidatus Dojkabacteria bacterium]
MPFPPEEFNPEYIGMQDYLTDMADGDLAVDQIPDQYQPDHSVYDEAWAYQDMNGDGLTQFESDTVLNNSLTAVAQLGASTGVDVLTPYKAKLEALGNPDEAGSGLGTDAPDLGNADGDTLLNEFDPYNTAYEDLTPEDEDLLREAMFTAYGITDTLGGGDDGTEPNGIPDYIDAIERDGVREARLEEFNEVYDAFAPTYFELAYSHQIAADDIKTAMNPFAVVETGTSIDYDGDAISDESMTQDFDGDGLVDGLDLDADGDGTLDADEPDTYLQNDNPDQYYVDVASATIPAASEPDAGGVTEPEPVVETPSVSNVPLITRDMSPIIRDAWNANDLDYNNEVSIRQYLDWAIEQNGGIQGYNPVYSDLMGRLEPYFEQELGREIDWSNGDDQQFAFRTLARWMTANGAGN